MTSKHKDKYINIIDIKYDSTCVDTVPSGLTHTMACNICQSKLYVHTKTVVSQRKKKDISTVQTSVNNIGCQSRGVGWG